MDHKVNRTKLGTALREKALANTQEGRNWVIKALHPADHEIMPQGMPTRDATSIVTTQFQREFLVAPAAEVTADTWDLDIWILRDPVLFCAYQLMGTDGSALTVGSIINQQLGENYAAGVRELAAVCEAFRVSYMSVTAHLIAPALANQGTVRAAQYEYPAYERPLTPATQTTACVGTTAIQYTDPLLSATELLQMPNSYENRAEEGFYMPLKMCPVDERFVHTNQLKYMFGREPLGENWYQSAAPGRRWPLYDTSQGVVMGYSPGTNIGHASFRGISVQASIQLVVRVGLDMKVRPGTSYSPFNHEPPVYDETALRMYYEIARRMSDAYPASYNATGALLPQVLEIARRVWPIIQPLVNRGVEKVKEKIKKKAVTATSKK